ncbi:alpha/beta fold hydrolase [Shewanella maritima]|uniref:Alpha/beta fold hydrolase n=1 Tax=Shewanella maritima TaxID=2520507 RepID=A0A411PFL5_9GAMM|nr:alpha/beta hydrolase [Shewanella maritima]QBF82192.1 alpha/beta fold hydrolase [Shewanella maritima]
MNLAIKQESLFLPYRQGQLHLRHIAPKLATHNHPPILMLHGAMSNGKVFYSDKGKGLACFLAKAGFDVYVLDSAGRGLSEPPISRDFNLGQSDVIKEQLPLAQAFILKRHPLEQKVHWCAHSWGGVLMASCIVRFEHIQQSVLSLLTFGTKRTIKVQNWRKWLMVDLVWNRLAPAYAKKTGFLNAQKLKMGMDNETRASLSNTIDWVRGDWIDTDDGFDYRQAAVDVNWPKTWFIAAKKDRVLGNPSDVQDMLAECGLNEAKYTLLAKRNGYLDDYDHASMLTAPHAIDDHFVQIRQWYLAHDLG